MRGVIKLVDPGRPADEVRALLARGFAGAQPRRGKPAARQERRDAAGSPPPPPPPENATVRIGSFLAAVRPAFPRWLGGKPQELDALLAQCS